MIEHILESCLYVSHRIVRGFNRTVVEPVPMVFDTSTPVISPVEVQIHQVTSLGIRSLGSIPKKSKYRTLVYELLEKEQNIDAVKFMKLRTYLVSKQTRSC